MTAQAAPPLAHAFAFPYPLPSVDSPRLVYGEAPTALHSLDREEEHPVRLTFERLDSLRVCRPRETGAPRPSPHSAYTW